MTRHDPSGFHRLRCGNHLNPISFHGTSEITGVLTQYPECTLFFFHGMFLATSLASKNYQAKIVKPLTHPCNASIPALIPLKPLSNGVPCRRRRLLSPCIDGAQREMEGFDGIDIRLPEGNFAMPVDTRYRVHRQNRQDRADAANQISSFSN